VVKLYDRTTPLPWAAVRNDRVLPFFASPEMPLVRLRTDRGTEDWGSPEPHQ
jgi:hypothetical protein